MSQTQAQGIKNDKEIKNDQGMGKSSHIMLIILAVIIVLIIVGVLIYFFVYKKKNNPPPDSGESDGSSFRNNSENIDDPQPSQFDDIEDGSVM